jgi:deazaflavin-dependent oxidoreductase (nitroreductase family)
MPSFADIPWIAEHIALYQSDPEKAHMWDSSAAGGEGILPTLLLTTTGHKSGKQRPIPLIYGAVDGGYAIIASKGGAPQHPAWYVNLLAQPECHAQIGGLSLDARARVAESPEREAIWKRMVEVYSPYDTYQANAGREIPVVVLEPRA